MNPNSLYSKIFNLSKLNFVNYFFVFISSVIIFRIVDRNDYGLWAVLLSFFAIYELVIAGLDLSVTRFYKNLDFTGKVNLVCSVLFFKLTVFLIFILLIFYFYESNFFNNFISEPYIAKTNLSYFLVLACVNNFLNIFIGTGNAIINSLKFYEKISRVGIFKNAIFFISVIALSIFTNQYIFFILTNSLLNLILLGYVIFFLISFYDRSKILKIFQVKFSLVSSFRKIVPYSLPLSLTSMLSYSKNHLPILILGNSFTLESVAIFSILKNIFKSFHSITSSFIEPMLMSFLDLKESKKYHKKMNAIFNSSLALRLIISLFLIVISDYVMEIYNIENSSVTSILFYIFSLEFFIAGLIIYYGLLIKLEDNTVKLFVSSLIRFSADIFLIYIFLVEYGILGAGIVFLLGRLIETFAAYFLCFDKKLYQISIPVLIISALLSIVILRTF